MEKTKKIKGFVSHRCKEFDNVIWRKSFELFLEKYSILPIYGCLLNNKFEGLISKNIENTIRESDIFIAVITPTWSEVDKYKNPIGWPKKEWELWKDIKGEKNNENCIGFIFNTKREDAPFIQDLVSFPISEKVDKDFMIVWFGGEKHNFLLRERDEKLIRNRLTRLANKFNKK